MVRFAAAFENTLLMVVPSVCIEAIATNAINTISNAYSVRSWPSSSFHNLLRIVVSGISYTLGQGIPIYDPIRRLRKRRKGRNRIRRRNGGEREARRDAPPVLPAKLLLGHGLAVNPRTSYPTWGLIAGALQSNGIHVTRTR